ncbi:hypothetical protein [Bradyrhizobium sp. AZCC 2230]|uniref:hypothetical protein n=1 Tax=Bradyrhizobium sp. AZCC 2230 TaxID=3117021 RepID=UPI002FEF0195
MSQRLSLLADNVERKSGVHHGAKRVPDFDRHSMALSPRGVPMKALLMREQPLPARRRKQKDRPEGGVFVAVVRVEDQAALSALWASGFVRPFRKARCSLRVLTA